VDQVLVHPWITHKASKEQLITAPNKLAAIVRAKTNWRKELGTVLHIMAVSRMEHLALKHGILQQTHIDEVHQLHSHHSEIEKDKPESSETEAKPATSASPEDIKSTEIL